MNSYNLIIIGIFYLIGLFSSAVFEFPLFEPSVTKWLIINSIILSLTLICAFIIPKYWRIMPRGKIWFIGGIIAILAVIYFQLRVPKLAVNDISQILIKNNIDSEIVTVKGKILDQPQLNQNNKIKFILQVNQVKRQLDNQETEFEKIEGKTYVTLPLLQGNGLYTNKNIEVTGVLYLPKKSLNPGAFDFQYYLAQRGVFSGISGISSNINLQEKEPIFALWKLRKRIVKAQVKALESPRGELLSSIVLGRHSVDLPYYIRDLFINSGLAHILAASGFHVTLLLGIILKLTQGFSSKKQFIIAITTLIFYITLTGGQASVCRAALMGGATLLGLVTQRKVNSLGALFTAGILLLIINPLWIWDLGFQLSFLATLGLILSASAIEKKLDFLFPVIASPLAVSLSATLWVFPLIIYTFKTFPLYGILVNVVTTPFVIIISLGGMISGFIALIYPVGGAFIAQFLYYPIDFLIKIVTFFYELPYSKLALGKFPFIFILIIYGIFIFTYVNPWLQKKLIFVFLLISTLIITPIFYKNTNLLQVTIFHTNEPNVMIQNLGENILISQQNYASLNYAISPFFHDQGINNLKTVVNLDQNSLINNMPIKEEITASKSITIESKKIKLNFLTDKILDLNLNDKNWLFLFNLEENLTINHSYDVLIWWGNNIKLELIKKINPKIAIAVSDKIDQTIENYLKNQQINLYTTQKDGAIQWQEKIGFQNTLMMED
jgi:competence protein ComEC